MEKNSQSPGKTEKEDTDRFPSTSEGSGATQSLKTHIIFGRNNRIAAIFWYGVILGWFLTLQMYDRGPAWWLWFLIASCIAPVRFWLAARLVRLDDEDPGIQKFEFWLHILIFAIGIHMCLFALFVPLYNVADFMIMIIFMVPTTMGSAFVLSPSIKAFYMHTLPPLGGIAFRAVTSPDFLGVGDWPKYTFVIAILFYTFYLVAMARVLRSEIARAVDLTSDLSTARSKIEKQAHEMELMAREHQETARLAEAASLAKSQILANTSHEIRTPMNAVLGMAQALKWETDETTRHSQIDLLISSGNDLKELLNDIIDLSRIESGHSSLNPKPLLMRPAMRSIVKMNRYIAEDKGVSLTVEIDSDVPEALFLDTVRARQCFANLLSNAVKFTDTGNIHLHVERLSLDGDQVELVLHVTDTGIGLSEEDQKTVFETFLRSDNPIAKSRPGAGLGLAITRKLAQQMGGDLTVESRLGMGSTFSFRWFCQIADADALKKSMAETSPVPVGASATLENARILLAEDHPGNRKVMSVFLGSVGIEPDMVVNGAELVERAETTPYDILLVDVHMPKLSGLEAVRIIRHGHGPNNARPIIMLTADAGDEALQLSLEHGADAHITKPIDAGELFSVLEHYLRGDQTH